MSGKVTEDVLASRVVTLGKDRGFRGLAGLQQGLLDGSMWLAKGTGPEDIIKHQYIQKLLWLEKKRTNELS